MNIITTHVRPTPTGIQARLGSDRSLDFRRDEGGRDEKYDATLLIVDSRALERECLALSLSSSVNAMGMVAVGKFDEWKRNPRDNASLAAVLLNIGGQRAADAATSQEIARIVREIAPAPLVVLADSEDVNQVLHVLELGAKGYIPTTVGIEVCAEAISLARAGGVFVPGSALISMRRAVESGAPQLGHMARMFTARQGEVLEALRRGKANKVIAHELDLKESTVKVHVRNIMKKVKATNRTEAVYKINDLLAQHGEA